jgi:nicotinate-nucleotide adenylyltransferase
LKVGVLGGTFDPIHLGHLAAAHAAMECAGLDRVLFIPSARPPHRGDAVAHADQRLDMVRLAIDSEKSFDASDIEVRRGGKSYTSDTLAELKRTHPHDELFLILGWDAARLLSTWHEPERVKQLATVVVVSRPETATPDAERLRTAGLDQARVVLCLRPTPDISASDLREAIARGEPVADKVPSAVGAYISSHHLYSVC